jgi:nucleotide-binding universal stress UspA family protein
VRTIDESLTRFGESLHPAPLSTARSLDGRTILVATNGRPESVAAIHVAFALARRRGARPELLRAFDADALALPGPTPAILLLADDLLSDEPHGAWKRELRLAVGEQLGSVPDWPAHVRVGSPAGSIVREAEAVNASLVVIGLRHHGIADRLRRDETSLHVARASRVPVLAVAPGLETLPRRVVVGVDFSRASLASARAALSVIDERGTLVLAYARPADDEQPDEACEGIGVIQTRGIAASFERLRADLAAPPGITVEPIVLSGDPVAELRTIAQRSDADLIAVGSHRHETIERWLLGTVTADLVRDGRTSLLVVPPSPPTRSARRYQ